MKNSLFLSLLMVGFKLCAQQHDFGISLLNYSVVKTNFRFNDTNVVDSNKGLNLQPTISYHYITKKNIEYSLHAGYFKNHESQNRTELGDVYSRYATYDRNIKSVFFRAGIAKRFYFENLQIVGGINIPFAYRFSDNEVQYFKDYETLSKRTVGEDRFYNKQAKIYEIGLNLQLSFYYSIFKNLRIGIDLNFGSLTSVKNGRQYFGSNYVSYDDPTQNVDTNQEIVFKNSISSNLNFQPTVGIRYCFINKQKVVAP